jgi:hypothetical protein
MAETEAGQGQYCCHGVNPITRKAMIFVGLVVDAPLNVDILESTAVKLVASWPVLGGQLIRTVRLTSPFASYQLLKFMTRLNHGHYLMALLSIFVLELLAKLS